MSKANGEIVPSQLFINLLVQAPTEEEIDEILKFALERDLTLEEIKKLLFSSPKYWEKIIKTANLVKEKFFGKKIYFYVPISFDSYGDANFPVTLKTIRKGKFVNYR